MLARYLLYKMYPYARVLPLSDQQMWPPSDSQDVIERRVREVADHLNKIPILTFKLSNVPAKIKLIVEYEKENTEQPSLLFDYVLGKHKTVSISIKDLIPLPDLVTVRIKFTGPKKYDEELKQVLGVELDNDREHELVGVVEFYDRPVYFIKPDFMAYEQKKKKSPRLIPFRMGFIRLVLVIEHVDGNVDRIKLGEAEVWWIRHAELCSTVAFLIKKQTKDKKLADKMYKECTKKFKEEMRHRDLWALLLIHRRYRDLGTGRMREEWRYKLYNFINTNNYQMRGKIRFGNQSFEIVDARKCMLIVKEDLGARF